VVNNQKTLILGVVKTHSVLLIVMSKFGVLPEKEVRLLKHMHELNIREEYIEETLIRSGVRVVKM
jgi:hypothetical protein